MSETAYGLADLVAELKAALEQPAPLAAQLDSGAVALGRFLANQAALEPYRSALDVGRGPWLLHEDATHGFVVTLLLKPRATSTPVHHHGEAWTLYGIFDGTETVHRYERHDTRGLAGPVDVRLEVDHVRQAGEVEVELPYAIHNETTGPERDTVAIAVRGRNLALIQQETFDLASGAVTARPGTAAAPLPSRPA